MDDLKKKWPVIALMAALWTTAMVGMTVEMVDSLRNIYNSMSGAPKNSEVESQSRPSTVTPPMKNPASPSP